MNRITDCIHVSIYAPFEVCVNTCFYLLFLCVLLIEVLMLFEHRENSFAVFFRNS